MSFKTNTWNDHHPKTNAFAKSKFVYLKTKNMKTFFLKISVFILLITIMGAGCKKDEEDLSYLDGKTPLAVSQPGFAIYKTKKDYFFNVSIRPYVDDFLCPELSENSSSITLYKGEYYYSKRFRLADGYIASFEESVDSYFTSLSFDEYIREKLTPYYTHEGKAPSKVVNSIIDKDPFTEFYYSKESFNGKAEITINEINQLIKEKTLENYFTKIK